MVDTLSNETERLTSREVRDHLAVDLLMSLKGTKALVPFLHGEHTLGSAAREARLPASTLAYWVGRLLRTGLIEVCEVRPRAGKAIPVYRATAEEFIIPLDAMPPGAREEFMHGGRHQAFETFVTSVDRSAVLNRGLYVRRDPGGGVAIGFDEADAATSSPVTEWWGTVHLTPDDAAELRSRLDALVEEYGNRPKAKGTRRYVMVVGVAPHHERRP